MDTDTRAEKRNFNPRTHEECDCQIARLAALDIYFNPRTHEECDL